MENNSLSYIHTQKIWISDDLVRMARITFIPSPYLLPPIVKHTPKSQISDARLNFIWDTFIASWFGVATSGYFPQNKLNFVIR